MSILEQVRNDVNDAMRAGDRGRAGALRMLANSLVEDAREGAGDEVAVLRRERKKRLEAAEAYRSGGSEERARTEEAEAELCSRYLPAELDDAAVATLVDEAIAEVGAEGQGDMGRVMSTVMSRVGDRADGKRVSEMVRERLGS